MSSSVHILAYFLLVFPLWFSGWRGLGSFFLRKAANSRAGKSSWQRHQRILVLIAASPSWGLWSWQLPTLLSCSPESWDGGVGWPTSRAYSSTQMSWACDILTPQRGVLLDMNSSWAAIASPLKSSLLKLWLISKEGILKWCDCSPILLLNPGN